MREGGIGEFFIDESYRGCAEHILSREDTEGALPRDILDHDQLSSGQIELLSSLMLANENEAEQLGEIAGQIFADSCRAVERKMLAEELAEIDRQEKEASHRGEDIAHLQMRRVELNRKLKKS